jgi:hypothetical protein
VTDRTCRRKAGVPKEITFKTKPAIAVDHLRWACAAGLPRGVVLMDAGYGTDTAINAKGKSGRPNESDSSVRTPVADARASSNCFIASCPARIMLSRYPCASADGGVLFMAVCLLSVCYAPRSNKFA